MPVMLIPLYMVGTFDVTLLVVCAVRETLHLVGRVFIFARPTTPSGRPCSDPQVPIDSLFSSGFSYARGSGRPRLAPAKRAGNVAKRAGAGSSYLLSLSFSVSA